MAFRGAIAGEGCDPVRRTVADIIGERFDTTEPARREKTAQSTAHLRLRNAGRTPQKLTDLIETPWARRLVAGEDQTAILYRCCALSDVRLIHRRHAT